MFPAVPRKWTNVSFEHWRAEGGFIVSAEMADSKSERIELQATTDGVLKLVCPWKATQAVWKATGRREILAPDNEGVISLATSQGDILVFTESDQ